MRRLVFIAIGALTVLALGQIFFSLFTIAGTILNGAGRTLAATVLCGATLALAGVLDYLAVPRAGLDVPRVLLWTASAQSVAFVVGFALMGVTLKRLFGAFMPAATAVRVAVAAAVAWGLGRFLPVARGGKLVVTAIGAAECLLVLVVFFVALFVLKEFTADDRAKVRKVLRRK